MTKNYSDERRAGFVPEWQRPEIVTTKSHNKTHEAWQRPCNPTNDIPYPEEVAELARQGILAKAEQSVKPETWEQIDDKLKDKLLRMIKRGQNHECKKECIYTDRRQTDEPCSYCPEKPNEVDLCENCIYNDQPVADRPCVNCDDDHSLYKARHTAGIHMNTNAPLGGWRGDPAEDAGPPGESTMEMFGEDAKSHDGCKTLNLNMGILSEANNIINGERQDSYGAPEDSFQIIADFWTTYIKHEFNGSDINLKPIHIADLMDLLKTGRNIGGKRKRDNYRDKCGYSAIAADRLMTEDK